MKLTHNPCFRYPGQGHPLILFERRAKGRQENICALTWQLLVWPQFTTSLPAPAFSEEVLEAMLSRLSRGMRADLTAASVTKVAQIFVCLGASKQTPKDVNRPGINVTWPQAVKQRMQQVLDHIDNGTLPYITQTSDKKKTIHGTYS